MNQQFAPDFYTVKPTNNLSIISSIKHKIDKKKQQMAHTRAEQQWPFTDTSMMSDLDDEYHQIIFLRLSNLYQKQTYLYNSSTIGNISFTPSSTYSDQKVVNALNILAHRFSILQRIIEINQRNPAGLWAIWLCVQGEWELTVIDDNVPCILQGNNPIIASSSAQNHVWPIIIEKAIVKVYGGKYSSLNKHLSESTETILHLLTGYPVQKFQVKKDQDTCKQIDTFLQRDFLVFCAIDMQLGINVSHKLENVVYLIQEIQDSLILFKAPNSDLIITQGNNAIGQQGQFQMSLEDFYKYFSEINVLKCHEQHNYDWISLDLSYKKKQNEFIECMSLVKFDINQDTHIYFTICQQDLNISLANEYAFLRVFVMTNGYEFIIGDYNQQQNLTLEIFLTQGSYSILIQSYYPKWFDNQKLTLQFFALHPPTNIQNAQPDFQTIERKIVKSIAISQRNKNIISGQNTRSFADRGQPDITVTNQMELGLLYFYYQNKGDKILKEIVEFDQLVNLVPLKQQAKLNEFDVNVPPNGEELVIYKFDPIASLNKDSVFSYKCSIKSLFIGNEGSEVKKKYPHQSLDKTNAKSSQVFNTLNRNQNVSQQINIQLDPEETDYKVSDLIRFMKDYGKLSQRVWKEEPIEVFCYIYQHAEGFIDFILLSIITIGVILLYLNCTAFAYEENLIFDLQNLQINCKIKPQEGIYSYQQCLVIEKILRFILEAYSHLLIYLDIVQKGDPYGFKYQSHYKFYPDN